MIRSRTWLKNLWITGYKPTQQDFADFFESFFNLLDDIVNITQVTTLYFRSQYSIFYYNFEAGTYVTKIYAKSINGTPSIKIGTTIGADDVLELMEVGEFNEIGLTYYKPNNYELHFTVVGGGVDVRIDKINDIL